MLLFVLLSKATRKTQQPKRLSRVAFVSQLCLKTKPGESNIFLYYKPGRQSIMESKLDTAVLWLQKYLKDGPKYSGPVRPPEPGTVIGDAASEGISYATLRRASDELGVQKKKKFLSKRWTWSLPFEETDSDAEPIA